MSTASLSILVLAALAHGCSDPAKEIDQVNHTNQNVRPSSPECGEVPAGAAPMAYLPEQNFCIDRTEVTWGQYMNWLQTSPVPEGLPAQCDPTDGFEPMPTCMEDKNVCLSDCDNRPMMCVDWCDAHAYCGAMNKRLCGAIGGGSVPFDQFSNAEVSQWFAACSSGGEYDYPYGDTFDAKACDGAGWQDQACVERAECPALEVASLDTCQAPSPPYQGVLDLSGNVLEWEDSCDWDTTLHCRLRGGSNYPDHADRSGLRCDFDSIGLTRIVHHTYQHWDVGFRCCRDLE